MKIELFFVVLVEKLVTREVEYVQERIVEKPVETVVERMAARYRALRVGPATGDPEVGPLISRRQQALVLLGLPLVPRRPSGGDAVA
jgi:hypothetical protein